AVRTAERGAAPAPARRADRASAEPAADRAGTGGLVAAGAARAPPRSSDAAKLTTGRGAQLSARRDRRRGTRAGSPAPADPLVRRRPMGRRGNAGGVGAA